MKLLKILIILAVGLLCTFAAAYGTESYAADVAAREKTLAEAVMQSRLEEQLKKAEEQARIELEEQGETLVTSVMETKPAVTEPTETEPTETSETEMETSPTETEPPETEVTEEETSETEATAATEAAAAAEVPEEIVTDFTRGGMLPADRTGIPVKTMFGLTPAEQEQVVNFLIDHYFLDGFKYAEAETRPELKEKKLLAAEMESGAVQSLNMILNAVNVSDISSMLSADYGALKEEAEALRDEFAEKYSGAERYGEQFAALYGDSLKYFDRLISALANVEETAKQYSEAANPLLALGLLTSGLNDVIVPEIMGVLEQSFDLVETSQEIFLEGTTGARLLTRDEVRDIITNPALVTYANPQ
ncbi:MAG: hypothetical protein NC395_09885 [Prevotella sp.]|nr:hypothetical protein [Prevotella sp.]